MEQTITFKLTKEDKALIKATAKNLGELHSSFCRRIILKWIKENGGQS